MDEREPIERTSQDETVQLSLEVGGEVGAYVSSEFTLSGKLTAFRRTLDRDETVLVQVVDSDGEVVLRSEGWVRTVAIETVPETTTVPRYTKRKHQIKLGAPAPVSRDE